MHPALASCFINVFEFISVNLLIIASTNRFFPQNDLLSHSFRYFIVRILIEIEINMHVRREAFLN